VLIGSLEYNEVLMVFFVAWENIGCQNMEQKCKRLLVVKEVTL
jgi:hypothetical protein